MVDDGLNLWFQRYYIRPHLMRSQYHHHFLRNHHQNHLQYLNIYVMLMNVSFSIPDPYHFFPFPLSFPLFVESFELILVEFVVIFHLQPKYGLIICFIVLRAIMNIGMIWDQATSDSNRATNQNV